jgi:large subunit ribosomal protein L23
MDKTLFLKPRISEKTYGLSEVRNTYTFVVPGDANKHTVARAVAAQFNVTVLTVRIANQTGKPKRTVRKGARPTSGNRADMKKAYVTLKAGDKLPIFATEEDDKKSAKADKKEKK